MHWARRTLALLGAVALLTVYFLQTATLSPSHTDEGLLLEYIDDIAGGRLPFYDMADAYGLLTWVFPVFFYTAAGYHVWGIRIWMIVLKIVSILCVYAFVRTLTAESEPDPAQPRRYLGGRFYAVLSCVFMTVVLGASWRSLQSAYAFMHVIPYILGAWHFIVSPPLKRPVWNVLAAAVLTSIAIWTKLNTGMYLLAGGLFVHFLWLPMRPSVDGPPASETAKKWVLRARFVAVLAYAVLFTAYTRKYTNIWFFAYLTVPTLLALGWATHAALADEKGRDNPRAHIAPCLVLFGVTAILSLGVLFTYYGKHTGAYVRELAAILSSIKYTAPFPKPGTTTVYLGLNEYYWLQVPLVTTLLFAAWMFLGARFGERTHGASWPQRRARISALFMLCTLHSYVLYARADETHIFQALLLHIPVAVILLSQLDAFLRVARPSPNAHGILRFAVVGLTPYYLASLVVLPSRDTFDFGISDWHNPKLEHLRYTREHNPYMKDFSPDVSDRLWDACEDDAGRYVKSITSPGEEILLLTANRLIHFNSETRPVGGRFHFYFYLACVGLLDRKGFDRLVPPEIIEGILQNPPRVLIAGLGFVPLAHEFPELAELRDTQYERTKTYRHIWVYERKW